MKTCGICLGCCDISPVAAKQLGSLETFDVTLDDPASFRTTTSNARGVPSPLCRMSRFLPDEPPGAIIFPQRALAFAQTTGPRPLLLLRAIPSGAPPCSPATFQSACMLSRRNARGAFSRLDRRVLHCRRRVEWHAAQCVVWLQHSKTKPRFRNDFQMVVEHMARVRLRASPLPDVWPQQAPLALHWQRHSDPATPPHVRRHIAA